MGAHTPTTWATRSGKWIVATRGDHEGEILVSPTYWLNHAHEEALANAEFIVRAVNCHDDLVAALRRINAINHAMPKDDHDTSLLRSDKVETARRAFGDALSTRVNMNTRLGDVPVQAIREAMAEALEAIKNAQS